jgi:hypothetical protein
MLAGLVLLLFIATTNSLAPPLRVCLGSSCSRAKSFVPSFTSLDSYDLLGHGLAEGTSCLSVCSAGPNIVAQSGRVHSSVAPTDLPLLVALLETHDPSYKPPPAETLLALQTLASVLTAPSLPSPLPPLPPLIETLSASPTQHPYALSRLHLLHATSLLPTSPSAALSSALLSISCSPDRPPPAAHRVLAECYSELGRVEEAREALLLWKEWQPQFGRKADNMIRELSA